MLEESPAWGQGHGTHMCQEGLMAGPDGHSMGPQEAKGGRWGSWGHRGCAKQGWAGEESGARPRPSVSTEVDTSEKCPSCGDCCFPGPATSMPPCPAHSHAGIVGHSAQVTGTCRSQGEAVAVRSSNSQSRRVFKAPLGSLERFPIFTSGETW